jgi:hypothetical protein
MPVEVCSYRLTSRGRPVGSQTLSRSERGRTAFLEAKVQLQGALGQGSIVQSSRAHAERHTSQQFREETNLRGDQRQYDVRFDRDQGLVVANRGRSDRASVPYLRPYRDPLSLLSELRALAAAPWTEEARLRVPMLGKDVVVYRANEVEAVGPWGTTRARAFHLHPGGSVVVVELAPPHRILRLVQRLADGVVEATLVRTDEEERMQTLDAPAEERAAPSRRRGRRRGRRRRGKPGSS